MIIGGGNIKGIIIIFFILISVYAIKAVDKQDSIAGSDTSENSGLGSYIETSAGQHSASGGNITEMNLSSDSSTVKWQGYLGQVSGSLYLGSGTDSFFNFGSISTGQIKTVFASTDSGFNFGSLVAATASDVDTTFDWSTTDGDSGTNVLDDTTITIATVTNVPVANLTAHTAGGALDTSIYQVGVFKDDGSIGIGLFNALGFGVPVSADKRDYRNLTFVDYQIIVPVNSSGIGQTQTYYFFLDIE